MAAVDADGKVKAEEFGATAIVAIYLRQAGVVRLRVPQPLATPFPAVQANNKIDELVFANLKALGFPPSEVAGDDVFLRRVFLRRDRHAAHRRRRPAPFSPTRTRRSGAS